MRKKNRRFKRAIRLRISIILESLKENGELTVEQEKELTYLGKLLEGKLETAKQERPSKSPFVFDLATLTVNEYYCLRESGYTEDQIKEMCIETNECSFFEWKQKNGLVEDNNQKVKENY